MTKSHGFHQPFGLYNGSYHSVSSEQQVSQPFLKLTAMAQVCCNRRLGPEVGRIVNLDCVMRHEVSKLARDLYG